MNYRTLILIATTMAMSFSQALADVTILDLMLTQDDCKQETGSITIIAETSSANTLMYSIDLGVTFQEDNVFTGLAVGDYLIVVTDGSTCSEALSTQITSLQTTTSSQQAIICEGDTYAFGDETITESGSYTYAGGADSNGCDSIYYLDLVVIPDCEDGLPLTDMSGSICRNNLVLKADHPGAYDFQWYKNDLPIDGETNNAILLTQDIPDVDGSYKLFFTQDNQNKFTEPYEVVKYDYVTDLGIQKLCEGDSYTFGPWELENSGEFHFKTVTEDDGCDSSIYVTIEVIDCNCVIDIPDEKFLEWLMNNNVDQDANGIITCTEAEQVTEINVANADITTLAGIEQFPALTALFVQENQLAELDISGLPDLEILFAQGNEIQNLDLTQNLKLKQLNVSNNALTELDLTQASLLTQLYLSDNGLVTLDASLCPDLDHIVCKNNQLEYLNIKNGSLESIIQVDGNSLLSTICADELQKEELELLMSILGLETNIDTECITTSTVEASLEEGFKLFPNPVSDRLMITTDQNLTNLSIYTIDGKEIYSKTPGKQTKVQVIQTATFPMGLLIVKINTERTTYTQELFKK